MADDKCIEHGADCPYENAAACGRFVAAITRAVRVADEAHEKSGGSSRHWVRECFIPALDAENLIVREKENKL